MTLVARTEDQVNAAALDRWTWVHVSTGVMLGMLRVRPAIVVALLVGYELVEPELETWAPGLFEHPVRESKVNQVADVAAGLAGYAVGRLLGG